MSAVPSIDGSDIATTAAEVCEGAIFVTTMSSIALLDAVPGERDVFPAVAMMGAASTLGLGIALGRPDRTVVVLDGDGSLLMELGSLVTIAAAAPANLIHVVLDNGVWFGGTGEFAHPGVGRTDFVTLAEGAGYQSACSVDDVASLATALAHAEAVDGPAFIRAAMTPAGGKLWSADNPQPDLPDAYFDRVARQAAQLKASLREEPTPE
ncbi:thiamine pyrophosphate-dependent enzyme [Microbacterium alcoholitolerans]|uniref:thiamine pyrophosphate-dependent enzyme n=1 Tax=unclassified Microbacterium TaxID=2609290 RepID=UPI003D183D46